MKYEPTAADAARHIAVTLARWGCGLIICACIALAWIATTPSERPAETIALGHPHYRMDENWEIENTGSGNIIVEPPSGSTINGAMTYMLAPGAKARVIANGSNYYVVPK